MTASNDIRKRSEEIQLNIASDNVMQAIKLLLDFVKDFSADKDDDLNEVFVLSSNYTRLNKAERRGVLPYEEAELKRSKLLYQILGLIDAIKNGLALNLT